MLERLDADVPTRVICALLRVTGQCGPDDQRRGATADFDDVCAGGSGEPSVEELRVA